MFSSARQRELPAVELFFLINDSGRYGVDIMFFFQKRKSDGLSRIRNGAAHH